jgi:hypothetical protein
MGGKHTVDKEEDPWKLNVNKDVLAITSHDLDSSIRDTVRKSLSRLLPRLKANDSCSLLPRHIVALNHEIAGWHILKRAGNNVTDYTLALLKALEQVGTETSIPAVERMLQSTKNPKVREPAEACLPYLQAQASAGRHTLLRAASEEGGELLRAATGSEGPEANVLLRPTSDRASQ